MYVSTTILQRDVIDSRRRLHDHPPSLVQLASPPNKFDQVHPGLLILLETGARQAVHVQAVGERQWRVLETSIYRNEWMTHVVVSKSILIR